MFKVYKKSDYTEVNKYKYAKCHTVFAVHKSDHCDETLFLFEENGKWFWDNCNNYEYLCRDN